MFFDPTYWTKPYQIKEEDWKGVWFNKDAAVSIKVVDGWQWSDQVAGSNRQ